MQEEIIVVFFFLKVAVIKQGFVMIFHVITLYRELSE